ncbi:MAG: hypothetical protein WDM71_06150 [Ferruginibacter sp.]
MNAPPTTSNAGGHQSMCSASGNTVLAANNPSIGVGAWTILSGPSTLNTQFSDTTNHAAIFTLRAEQGLISSHGQ